MKQQDIDRLRSAAEAALEQSHSPYSKFPVGAAVLAQSGVIYRGCNVENASFSLTQCAERTALTAAVASGEKPGSMKLLLILTAGEQVHAPCGACRQVMVELMDPDSLVISSCTSGTSKRWALSELQPQPFTAQSLAGSGIDPGDD